MESWIPLALLAAAAVIYLFARIFGGAKPEAAQDSADAIKAAADAEMKTKLATVNDKKENLLAIQNIEDEDERLRALADYANKKEQP